LHDLGGSNIRAITYEPERTYQITISASIHRVWRIDFAKELYMALMGFCRRTTDPQRPQWWASRLP
jgi:hypothetical protein